MKFQDFKSKYGQYHAYENWLTIEDAKLLEMIPKDYHEIFKNDCECGSENIIAPNLKRLTCCDPNCYVKVGHRLAEMFSRFGVVGLGYASCANIYRTLLDYDKMRKNAGKEGIFHFDAYTEVLTLKREQFPTSVVITAVGDTFISACEFIRGQHVTFPQLVSSLGLTSLGSNSSKIFEGINSFTELKNEIDTFGGVTKYCISKGVSSFEVIFSVASSLKEIAVADFALQGNIRKVGLIPLEVCITGRVAVNDTKYTKKSFIDACNNLCVDENGTQLLEVKNTSGPVTASFVLYTNHSGSAKYNTGKSRGYTIDSFGRHPVLITVTEFYNWLKEGMKLWNESLRQGEQKDFLTVMQQATNSLMNPSTSSSQKIQAFS